MRSLSSEHGPPTSQLTGEGLWALAPQSLMCGRALCILTIATEHVADARWQRSSSVEC